MKTANITSSNSQTIIYTGKKKKKAGQYNVYFTKILKPGTAVLATETLENKCKRQHFHNIQAGWDHREGLCSPSSTMFSTIMLQCETVLWLSPALLVGSSVIRRSLTHHSHVAVFGHDSVTFSEHWPLIWEGTHH